MLSPWPGVTYRNPLVEGALAPNTIRVYRREARRLRDWCTTKGYKLPLTPQRCAEYFNDMAARGLGTATIAHADVLIALVHRSAGLYSPTADIVVRQSVRAIRRRIGAPSESKRALLVAELRTICELLPPSGRGVRDRALLLTGWAGALRRSEVVALNAGDLRLEDRGIIITIARSKTDQEGHGRLVPLPYGSHEQTCPVRALQAWTALAAYSEDGPLFRPIDRWGRMHDERLSPAAVGEIVRYWAGRAGLPSAEYGGHSLRSGLATSAAAAGKSERAIQRQTGHRSLEVLRRYIHRGTIWDDCAAADIGL